MGEVVRIDSAQEEQPKCEGGFREILHKAQGAEFNSMIRSILGGRHTTKVSRLTGLLAVVRYRTNELSPTLLGSGVPAVVEFALRTALSDNDLMRSVPKTINYVNFANSGDRQSYRYLIKDTEEYTETPVFAVLAATNTVAFFTPEMMLADYYMRRKILDAVENQ